MAEDQCKLYRSVARNSAYFLLAVAVADCNRVIGSNARADRCRECGGREDTCTHHTGASYSFRHPTDSNCVKTQILIGL